eukprot:4111911-Alexandrium_andersonii.AAC.1
MCSKVKTVLPLHATHRARRRSWMAMWGLQGPSPGPHLRSAWSPGAWLRIGHRWPYREPMPAPELLQ